MTDTFGDQAHQVERREAGLIGLAFVFLILLAASLSLSTAARLGSWDSFGDRWGHWGLLPVWLGGCFLLRRALRRVNPIRDPLLLPIPMLFIGWGVLTIWRLDPTFGLRQLGWFVLAIASLYLMLRPENDLRWIRRYRYLWISLGLALMGLTLLFGTHPGGGSPRLWLGCCGFYFQPSEVLRLLLVAFLASYLGDRLPFRGFGKGGWDARTWLPLIWIWLLSFGLLIVQRDLGTGMLFLALLTMLLYLVVDRWQVMLTAGLLGLAGGVVGYLLFDVVAVRIEAWLSPWNDPLGGSFQIIQSMITIASGGIFGRGMGMGSPGFVPAIHTDFIFTAMVEEHGLLAGIGLIVLWAVWISRVLKSSSQQRDPFSALLTAGLGISLGLQAILIVGGNLRLLPLVGITLPFTSYGGTSLLISVLSLGLLLILSKEHGRPNRFKAPIRRLHTGMLMGWIAAAAFLGWWIVIRGPALTARSDNPRWAVDSRYSLRGSLVDRNGSVLAGTGGSTGSYGRSYPYPSASPLVGYDVFPYGQAGLEESLDGILRGLERQNPWGIFMTQLSRGMSPAGSDVRLALDAELQLLAQELLAGHQGAIVLIDADQGDLLVAASAPTYDPNTLAEQWSELVADPGSPLLNRALQGRYQPGTALIPFIVAQAIDNGWASLGSSVESLSEAVEVDGGSLECASTPARSAPEDLKTALILGCPKPIQLLTESLGIQFYADMLRSFGLGDTDQAGVEAGELPDPPLSIDLGLAAVGQFDLTLTPLQVGRALAPLVADGEIPTVRIVDAIRVPGGAWSQFEVLAGSERAVSTTTADLLWAALGADGRFNYQASALAGGPLGWFLGGARGLGGNYALVVVLENEASSQAQLLGMTLLDAALANALP